MISVVGLLLTIALRQAPSSAPAAPTTPLPQIDALLGQLSDPRYEIREEATQNLCALGEGDLSLLYKRYRAESRYEIKRRLRYIIESVFHRGQLMGRDGFMGVQVYRYQTLADLTDPASGRTTRGVVVSDVKPGFAAERAGVRNNDIIIGLNDEPIPEDPTPTTFVQRVGSHRPGTTISLRVLRQRESRKLHLKGGAEPEKLFKAVQVVMASDVSSPAVYCISKVEADSAAARAGFLPNQILKSINGYPLGGNPLEVLVRGIPSQTDVVVELADTEVITLPIRLGRRPPEFADPKDYLEAQTRFIRWWQEQGGDTPARFGSNMMPRMVWNAMTPRRIGPETTLQP